VVPLETDACLVKPIDLQWKGNPFIKNVIFQSNVLDLNGANNAASKLWEPAAQRDHSLMSFS
jgi:hypothetical protein